MISPKEIKRIKIELCLGTFDSWELNDTFLMDLYDQGEFGIITCLRKDGYWSKLLRAQRFDTGNMLISLSDRIKKIPIEEMEKMREEFACGIAIHIAKEACPELKM